MSRHELVVVDGDFGGLQFVKNLKGAKTSIAPIDRHPAVRDVSDSAEPARPRESGASMDQHSANLFLLVPADLDTTLEGDGRPEQRSEFPSLIDAHQPAEQPSTLETEIHDLLQARDPAVGRFVQTFMTELDRQPHPAQRLIAEAMCRAIATHLLRSCNWLDPAESSQPLLSQGELAKIKHYVENNIERSIKLANLAALTKVSRSHFARLFKRSTGMTAMSFVEQCRIHRAQTLILESNIPLVEVALMTGFSDQSHFTRRFCRRVGCTPAVFAREHGHRRSAQRIS